jgi:hypothetical protein
VPVCKRCLAAGTRAKLELILIPSPPKQK